MPIAQMNWGILKHDTDSVELAEFLEELDLVYKLAEESDGYIWRLDPETLAEQLRLQGWSDRSSVTVSVWQTQKHLHDFTFKTLHGQYLEQRNKWYETVEGPQLVMWDVEKDARPDFTEAEKRLNFLKKNEPSNYAYGWNENL